MRTLAISLGVGLLLFAPLNARAADPLQQVLKSNDFLELSKKTNSKSKAADWIERGSNLDKLFRKRETEELLVQWLTIDPKQGKPTVNVVYQEREWLGFDGATAKGLGLRVRVPHPRHKASADLGLIDGFKDFHPLSVELSFTQETEILNFPATLRQYKTGHCQLTIAVGTGAVVELSQAHCEDMTVLPRAAHGLNIKRLSNKLKT